MTLENWEFRHSEDVEARQEFVELLDWFTNPFSTKNIDRVIFKFKTQGIGLVGRISNSDKVIREIISSIGPDFSNTNLGPRLKIITTTNKEYILEYQTYEGVIRNGSRKN